MSVVSLPEAKIIDLYESGLTQAEIGRLLHCSASGVRCLLVRNGVELRPWRKERKRTMQRLPNKEIEKTVFLYVKLGMTLDETADHLGVTRGTVLYRLRKAGVKTRPKSEAIKLGWERQRKNRTGRYAKLVPLHVERRCAQLYEEGYSSIEVGRMMDLRDGHVRDILKRQGVRLRSTSEANRLYQQRKNQAA